MAKKGKQYLYNALSGSVLTFILILLVGVASFGLGRLSAVDSPFSPLYNRIALIEEQSIALALGGKFVASKNGSAYYFPWCSGVERINTSNMIWFDSREKAEKAGYAPAKNCKGLQEN